MYFVMYYYEGEVHVAGKKGYDSEEEAIFYQKQIMEKLNAFIVKKVQNNTEI